MKKQILGLLLLVCALAITFLIMSCAPGPQNTNQAFNSSATPEVLTKITKPCTLTTVNNDVNAMVKNAGLGDQNNGIGNPNGIKNFEFRVVEMGNPVIKVLIIEGAISDGKKGDPTKNAEHMEKLIKDIDQLITKDCVDKAVFVKRGTVKSLDDGSIKPLDVDGFEWSTCDWPNIPCGDGTCGPSCSGSEIPTTNTSANTNANQSNTTNANKSNTNVNSNTNRAP